jgi:Protein of unknown function (DUF3108)
MRRAALSAPARRALWCALLALVLLLHGGVKWWADEALVGWGLGDKPVPARMEVAFVRALAPSAAPAPAPAPMPRAKPRAAEPAASMPAAPVEMAPVEPAPAPAPDVPSRAEAASVPASEPPLAAAPAVPAASAPAPAAPAAPPFEWPPSTRLTYKLFGNYRGEVHGSARVQWVRQDLRYQVHLDVAIGPSFAPLLSRRTTSDGTLGADGLVPRRYDEATKLPFQSERRATLAFGPEWVTLANGSQREALPGVQDPASQFVQLTWLFTTRPELLRVGNAILLPLALPRRVDRWVYDVVGEDKLQTPLGVLDAFHLKPRRAGDRPRGELSAEMWFAPTLQYLPVRIRIQQDSDTFVDLVIDSAPMQAESPPR